MKKTEQALDPPRTSTLDGMTRALAAGLRDVIEATSTAYLREDPEDAFIDLAARLIFRLREELTVVPIPHAAERARIMQADAAARIFDIFTRWMKAHPGRSYETRISASGKFQVVVKTKGGTQLFFGGDVQDAYAQAAQAIDFNGGTL